MLDKNAIIERYSYSLPGAAMRTQDTVRTLKPYITANTASAHPPSRTSVRKQGTCVGGRLCAIGDIVYRKLMNH
jgi:hypothetical protein